MTILKLNLRQLGNIVLCLTLLPLLAACAEGVPLVCDCGIYETECIPCPEDRAVDLPDGDAGVPVLNQENINEQNGYYLNQEGDGRFIIYTGEATEIGVRVISNYGNPTQGIRISFELVEADPNSPSGVQLRSRSAESNEFGIAKVALQAGPNPAFLRMRMTAPNATGLGYDIDVRHRRNLDSPNNPGNQGPNNNVNCLRTKGTYGIVNRYQPASILGSGFNDTLMTIRQILTDPGELVAEMVADNIGGVVGNIAGAAVRFAVNYVFQYVVQNHLPDWAQRTIGITTDVSTALTDLEVRGTIQLGDEDPMACTLQGIHRWETLVFIWRDGCAPNDDQCGRYEIPMNELGISASETPFDAEITDHRFVDTMIINEHQLQMNIGIAMIWFLERTVLPRFFDGLNSFGDLLALVIPCDAVGRVAADNLPDVPFVNEARIVEDACRSGLRAAGQRLAREFADRLSIDTFAMSGECKLRDTDMNQTVDKIEDGVWNGQLQGTFAGERQ
jgi:hypothetical protein